MEEKKWLFVHPSWAAYYIFGVGASFMNYFPGEGKGGFDECLTPLPLEFDSTHPCVVLLILRSPGVETRSPVTQRKGFHIPRFVESFQPRMRNKASFLSSSCNFRLQKEFTCFIEILRMSECLVHWVVIRLSVGKWFLSRISPTNIMKIVFFFLLSLQVRDSFKAAPPIEEWIPKSDLQGIFPFLSSYPRKMRNSSRVLRSVCFFANDCLFLIQGTTLPATTTAPPSLISIIITLYSTNKTSVMSPN